jgi:hypothetical protein
VSDDAADETKNGNSLRGNFTHCDKDTKGKYHKVACDDADAIRSALAQIPSPIKIGDGER